MGVMSEVLQANIFFFITGIAVIVFTLLLCIALYHLIKILKSLRRVMDRIEAGSEIIAEDLESIRAYFTEKSPFSRFIGAILGERKGTARQTPKRATPPQRQQEHTGQRTELKIKGES
jgi:hypothetical protein